MISVWFAALGMSIAVIMWTIWPQGHSADRTGPRIAQYQTDVGANKNLAAK